MRAALLLLLAGTPLSSARATPILSFGISESLALPDVSHEGVYLYTGLSFNIVFDDWFLTPWVGIEGSPDARRWGFLLSLTADFPVSDTVGIDVTLEWVHDQSGGGWSDALFYQGIGSGVSFTVGRVVLSPALMLYVGLNVESLSLAPIFTIGFDL